jgi:hypothetical protein
VSAYIPSDGVLVHFTPERARGPLLIFRKIHYHRKTKKSTHGHQTTKPFCTHFFNMGSEYAFLHVDSDSAGFVAVGRLWEA